MERVLGSASNPAGVGYRCGAAVGLVTALYGEGRRAWEAEAQLLLSAGLEALPGVLGMGECLLWHNSSCCVRWERTAKVWRESRIFCWSWMCCRPLPYFVRKTEEAFWHRKA